MLHILHVYSVKYARVRRGLAGRNSDRNSEESGRAKATHIQSGRPQAPAKRLKEQPVPVNPRPESADTYKEG